MSNENTAVVMPLIASFIHYTNQTFENTSTYSKNGNSYALNSSSQAFILFLGTQ